MDNTRFDSLTKLDKEVDVFSRSRKPSGTFIFTTPNGVIEFHSASCKHCGVNWQVVPGSGKKRGFCYKCQGTLCGAEECFSDCLPREARLEIMEGNRKTIMRYKDTLAAQKIMKEYGSLPILK